MRAAVFDRYGPPEVLRLEEVEKPFPRPDEVLVGIHATTVNSGDVRVRAIDVPRGLGLVMRVRLLGLLGRRSRVLGLDLAGVVEAAGEDVTRFAPGDRVVGSRGFAFGCHAEYRCIRETGAIAAIPEGIGDEEAVAVCFGGATTLAFFEQAGLRRGDELLINGASGAVGTAAVQIAKHIGAEVTGVCSAESAELVASLGADHVIDYAREDFAKSGSTYDVIMDAVGNAPYSRVKGALNPGGRLLMLNGGVGQMLQATWTKAVLTGGDEHTAINGDTYRRLMAMVAEGVLRPVIDRTYTLDEIVEAHRYVETGHKKGNVIIRV